MVNNVARFLAGQLKQKQKRPCSDATQALLYLNGRRLHLYSATCTYAFQLTCVIMSITKNCGFEHLAQLPQFLVHDA